MLNQRVTGKFPTYSERLRGPKKKTAAVGVGAQGGGNLVRKALKTSKHEHRAIVPRLARLIPIWSDDRRHFQGWEVAYA